MRRYHVAWTEYHEAEVEASSMDNAYEKATEVDWDISLKSTTHIEAKPLEDGYCSEHGEYEEDICPRCQAE